MRRSISLTVLCFALCHMLVLPYCFGAEPSDPIRAEEEKIAKDLNADGLHTQRVNDDARVRYLSKIAIRDFLASAGAERGATGGISVQALRHDRPYVVEEISFADSVDEPGRRVLRKKQVLPVIVFGAKDGALLDLGYLSYGLLFANRIILGSRALRSDGPYERYLITVDTEGGKGRVLECKGDATFDSDAYIRENTARRVLRLMGDLFSLPPAARRKALPPRADVPFPDKEVDAYVGRSAGERDIRLQAGGKIPQGPWQAGVLASDRGPHEDAEEYIDQRYVVIGRYDRPKDELRIESCKRDRGFDDEIAQRQRVAAFVAQFIQSDEEARAKVRRKGIALMPLKKAVKIPPTRVPYSLVRNSPDGSWTVYIQIHLEGEPVWGCWLDCRVAMRVDGKLEMAEEKWGWLQLDPAKQWSW